MTSPELERLRFLLRALREPAPAEESERRALGLRAAISGRTQEPGRAPAGSAAPAKPAAEVIVVVELSWSRRIAAVAMSGGQATGIGASRPGTPPVPHPPREAPPALTVRSEILFVADNFALSRTRPTRALELDDYAVLGLGFSQALFADRLRIVGRFSNLLDRSYTTSIGFPSPGRQLFLALELCPSW